MNFVIVQALFKTVSQTLVLSMLDSVLYVTVIKHYLLQFSTVLYLNASETACFIHIGIKTIQNNVDNRLYNYNLTLHVICL